MKDSDSVQNLQLSLLIVQPPVNRFLVNQTKLQVLDQNGITFLMRIFLQGPIRNVERTEYTAGGTGVCC